MKTEIFRFLSFSFALLLLVACSRDGQPFLPDDTDGDNPVDIVVSRSTFTGAGNGEAETRFTPGCRIGVSVEGSAAYQNVQYEYPASGSALVAVGEKIYCGAQSVSSVKAYYPYRSDGAYSVAFVEADQSSSDNYYKSDALTANGTIGNGALNLTFAHRMAKAIFTFNEDVTEVTILNQSLNTSAVTGSSSIKAYRENAKKWKACIVPEQTQLKVTGKKGSIDFYTAFNVSGGIRAGSQYTFNVKKVPSWDLSTGSLDINDNGTYYVVQRGSGTTNNSISISGSPTVYIDNLNISAGVALKIKSGSPVIWVVGDNTLKSTGFGASGVQLGEDWTSGSITIKGSGKLTATGGSSGCGIGKILALGGGGDITIEDCTVIAKAGGDVPAGIGSREGASCRNIIIKNAMITSTGGNRGAGIGSGVSGGCGSITITLKQGDTKSAFLGRMQGYTGVGAGESGNCGTITWYDSNGAQVW